LSFSAPGMILFDRGAFAAMREVFRQWRAEGVVTPSGFGRKIKENLNRMQGRQMEDKNVGKI